jgi:hypothetical protein
VSEEYTMPQAARNESAQLRDKSEQSISKGKMDRDGVD